MRPEDIVYYVNELNLKYNLSIVAIETRAYQKALLFAFTSIAPNIPVWELPTDTRSKELRIKSVSFKWNRGELFYGEEVDPSKLVQQVISFNSGSRMVHDDILDVVAYMLYIPIGDVVKKEYNKNINPNHKQQNNLPRLFRNI